MIRPHLLLSVLLLSLSLATPSTSLTLDFYESLAHGAIGVDGFADFDGYSVSVSNPNQRFDYGIAFDSDGTGSADRDLEYAWRGGNLEGTRLGKILVVQENDRGCDDGICDSPDDQAYHSPTGLWSFGFDDRYSTFALNLIDVDDGAGEEGFITFTNRRSVVSVFRIDLLPSLLPDQDIVYGNRHANRVEFSAQLIGGFFDGISISLDGSGAIDHLVVGGHITVPEPGTAALLGAGLLGMAARRRRLRLPPARD